MPTMTIELTLLRDGDRELLDVDVPSTQPEQLALAEPDERGDEDEASQPWLDRVGELVCLRDRGDRSFRGAFDTSTLDRAGVGRDQSILDGGAEDGAEESVALRGRARPGPGGPAQVGVPVADLRRRQLGESGRAERRDDVEPELGRVEVTHAGPERIAAARESRLDPYCGVLGEGRRRPGRRLYRLPVGLIGDGSGVRRLGGALGRIGAEAEPSAVDGDDANAVLA